MLWSSRDTLEIIALHCPRQLVSATPLFHSKKIAALLPKGLSSCYWECRLTDGSSQVDFLTCIAAADRGREALASGLSDLLLRVPLWNRVEKFFRQWTEPGSLLHEQVPLIWFEFDQVHKPLPAVPLPSFSFCVDPLYAERRTWEQYLNSRNPQRRREVAEEGLSLLFGAPLTSHSRRTLAGCFAALPESGRIIHISAMLARRPAVIKVYGSVPRAQLFPFLAEIGWPGPRAELEEILTIYCTPETVDHNMFIDISIEETVLPKLGIAFAQQQIDNLTAKDPTRKALLELCVQTGVCTPEKRDALLTWPGSFRTVFKGEKWPARFHKWLDVKFIYQPGPELETKAYLGFMPQFSLL